MKDIPDDKKLDEIYAAISSEDSLAAHISNAPGVIPVPNLLEQIRQITGDPDFTFGEFVPHTYYHEGLNFLEYIEEDCCTVTEYIPNSNIELMRKWDGEKYCGIVGIKIWGFHTVAPSEVIEAYKAQNKKRCDPSKCWHCGELLHQGHFCKAMQKKSNETLGDMCVECGRYRADPPSNLCPGCEAYQDHTRV